MPSAEFEHASRTHVGCHRILNEDAVLECPEAGLCAVADGMGGHEAGDLASLTVVEALRECASSGQANLRQVLMALDLANARLAELSMSKFEGRTIGSTVVGLILDGTEFICFWAGDSRAYRIRERRIERLTRDHSVVQDLVDAGMLSLEGAKTHPDANIITRAVGVSDLFDVETLSGEIRPGDTFLLASDGLTRLLGDEELLAEIDGKDLDRSASRLLEIALERGAPDNVSLAIVRARQIDSGHGSH
ncbi:MAG TPA: protein phosphatase 2C domain-containing protein [Sphingomicrobium sp.]|nr:protein phosphatase 2C domain-containing protein [Sphingomicrobium sp.]